MYYLLLDEIQMLDCFEAVLNGYLRKDNMNVFVIGGILGVFGSGNNHFRISISNLKQRRVVSLKCSLPGNVVADLNIKFPAASLSNKVDFLLIELADINIVSTAKKLDANDVFI